LPTRTGLAAIQAFSHFITNIQHSIVLESKWKK